MRVRFSSPTNSGCAMIYALYMWFFSAIIVVGGILLIFALGKDMETNVAQFLKICGSILFSILIIVSVPILIGIGVYQMKRWGMKLAIGLHGFFSLLSILLLITAIFDPANPSKVNFSNAPIGIFPLLLNVLFILWFYSNSYQFKADSRTIVMPSPIAKLNASQATRFLSTALLIIVIATIGIVITTILGPEIGKFFTQLSAQIQTPPP